MTLWVISYFQKRRLRSAPVCQATPTTAPNYQRRTSMGRRTHWPVEGQILDDVTRAPRGEIMLPAGTYYEHFASRVSIGHAPQRWWIKVWLEGEPRAPGTHATLIEVQVACLRHQWAPVRYASPVEHARIMADYRARHPEEDTP